MLVELSLAPSYASDTDDIGVELYAPCLTRAIRYDRISGFFSSTAYALTWPSLRGFVQRGGTIRLVCSPRLSEADAESLMAGYDARSDAQLAEAFRAELEAMLDRQHLRDSARLLAALVAREILDVRLAALTEDAPLRSRAMFHDKVGVFIDEAGHSVGFRGTLNESYLGISRDGNIESVDVWTSWEGGKDVQRLRDTQARFERIWEGRAQGIRVMRLPGDAVEFVHDVAADFDMDALLEALSSAAPHEDTAGAGPWRLGRIKLRRHQIKAVEQWRANDYQGLLEHATGSGKTITGLFCAREAIAAGLTPLVVVPANLLQDQWCDQIKDVLGVRVHTYGGGGRTSPDVLRAAFEADTPRAVVAVAHSAANPVFLNVARRFANRLFLLADEAHRLGSSSFRRILQELPARARLGLSATPERAGDPEGTQVIFDYFDRIVHRYTLKDALDDGVLAKYIYVPTFVTLSSGEQEDFNEFTRRIKRLSAIAKGQPGPSEAQERLARALIQRARILKNAAAKPAVAAELVEKHFREGQRWLVYCDNQEQVAQVREALVRRELQSWAYFRGMEGDPENTLRALSLNGGIVVSIRCLDEGVDIPAADHALILASSRNPREHIQRRGRVLRRAPWKTVATVLDTVTLPHTVDSEDTTLPVVMGEMARALQFAEWSLTRDAGAKLRAKWMDLGLPLDELPTAQRAGIETDTADEEGDP
jgi:superfamily II DNA or RNA helicase